MDILDIERAAAVVKALQDAEIARKFTAEELIDRAAKFVDSLKNEASLRAAMRFGNESSH